MFSEAQKAFGCVNLVISHGEVVVWLLFVSQTLTAALPH